MSHGDTRALARRGAVVTASVARGTAEGLRRHRMLADVQRFCLFVGYPRSGTTLVGAALNAHPEMVVANELDVLRYVRLGLRRHQLYGMLLRQDRRFSAAGHRWTGFDYAVPGQHQGRVDHLRVIGDKRAGMSTNRLRARPDLLDRLRRTVGVPLRVLHVVRSPFDTVATMARRRGCGLDLAIDHYARLAVTVDEVRARLAPDELVDVRYEAFIADPAGTLAALCASFGISAPDDYLAACAAIVRPAPSLSRNSTVWSASDRRTVEALVARRPVLAGYAWDA